jgi:methyl-accepting chemotaxis protein
MSLSTMSLRTQIAAGTVATLVIAVVVGALSLLAARSGSRLTGAIPMLRASAEVMGELTAVDDAAAKLSDARVAEPATRRALVEGAERSLARLEALAREVEGLSLSPEQAARWKEFMALQGPWRQSTDRFLGLQRTKDRGGDPAAAMLADAQAMEAFVGMSEGYRGAARVLAQLVEGSSGAAAALAEAASTQVTRGAWITIACFLAGLAALAAVGRAVNGAIRRTAVTLVAESDRLRAAVDEGRLDKRASADAVPPEFRAVVAGMNRVLDAVVPPLRFAADRVDRIARGDIPPPIEAQYRGEFDALKTSLNRCGASLTGLLAGMDAMSRAHDAGEVDAAIDSGRFQGAYAGVAEQLNRMVRAYVVENRKTMACVAEFGRGNFDAPLERFPGQKAFINDTVEKVRGNVKRFIAEMTAMSAAHDAGDTDAVIDAARFEGDFRAMAEGVNGMVAGHLGVNRKAMACVAQFGQGDFDAPLERFPGKKAFINETVEQVRAHLKALIADADGLVRAAVEGRLGTRADATRHQGDFRKIVDGVNRTLDAVLAPVQESARVLDRLARRDLRARATGSYQGDHAAIKECLNATASALHDALAQVAAAVEQVASAAADIAGSAEAVATGAARQTSALTETSTLVESVSAIATQAAESASQANALATAARGAATEGASAVAQMHGAMGRIRKSAESTSQIIRDINEIAFQTNLLALNAAVEAARAGDAGRGFAVVAEEVRSLALRAKDAARRTEELIRQSVTETNEGEATAQAASARLKEIVSGVEKVTGIVSEIASAATQQAAGIERVSRTVSEMQQVMRQNAESAGRSSAVASRLSAEAGELSAMVGGFQLEERAASPRGVARVLAKASAAAAPAHVPA